MFVGGTSGTRLLLVALLCLPFGQLAQAVTTTDTGTASLQPPAADANGLDPQTVRRELDSFRAAQVPLSKAMTIAEALHAGSATADISFDSSAGQSVYRVKTIKGDRVWENAIDVASGKVIGNETASTLKTLGEEDRGNLLVLRTLRHGLSDAVRVAEHTTSGKAISGGMMRERGKLNFVIVVLSGDDLKQVVLEPPGARIR